MGTPYLEIVKQPAEFVTKFRYESEANFCVIHGAGHITGNPSYPTVKVENYAGKVILQLDCVTGENPIE